jgi:hypothetical protein
MNNIPNDREFRNFSQWPLKALIAKERSFTVGDMRGTELRAEIQRRYDARNQRYLLATLIAAATSAFGSMIAAIASSAALHFR